MERNGLNSSENFNWEEFREHALQCISDNFFQMKELWQRIGIEGRSLKDRWDRSLEHHTDLFERMYEEDSSLFERLQENVQESLQRLEEYCHELDLPVPQFPHCPPLQLDKLIEPKLQKLEQVRQARLERLEELRQQENVLCECLRMEPHVFVNERTLPTEQDLEELRQHVVMLDTEKDQRYRKYSILRNDIKRVLLTLERNPSSDLDHEICSETNEKDVILSQDKLVEMKAAFEQLKCDQESAQAQLQSLVQKVSLLWDCLQEDRDRYRDFRMENEHCGKSGIKAFQQELERCLEIRRSNMGQFVVSLRQELVGWWEKCLASEEERELFEPFFTSEDFSEDLLKVHEKEVLKWKKTYEDFQGLFTKIQQFQGLYLHALHLQHNTNNPDRYNNRGGRLLQEERERKKILKLLPKLETDVLQLSEQYEMELGRKFTIGGISLQEYLESQWEGLQREKENEKQQRKQRRQEEDLGVATPAKRARNFAIPSVHITGVTPLKTPGSGMSVRHMGTLPASPALRSPGATLGRASPSTFRSRRQLLKTPKNMTPYAVKSTGAKAVHTPHGAVHTPHSRATLREQNPPSTSRYRMPPTSTKGAATPTPSTSTLSMTYTDFKVGLKGKKQVFLNSTALEDTNLNDPAMQASNKRSTMNSSQKLRVLGSKRTPTFTNSGTKRKRLSNTRSPRLQQSTTTQRTALKLAATNMPFLY